MTTILIIVAMMVIGAVIGGVTNMIAVKMLFHPYYEKRLFGKRLPFTPGLIPKRRHEISVKIGDVIEKHLLTEQLIREKLESPTTKSYIHAQLLDQFNKFKSKDVTIQSLGNDYGIDISARIEERFKSWLTTKTDHFYQTNKNKEIKHLLPETFVDDLDKHIDQLGDLLLAKARDYLDSTKGKADINDMLDTFFVERGKILNVLQMFMSREAIADRIQTELIHLTNHPKAKGILKTQLTAEYEAYKEKPLDFYINEERFKTYQSKMITAANEKLNLEKQLKRPLSELFPSVFNEIENVVLPDLTDKLIVRLSKALPEILEKINIKSLIITQIDRFELDYIEKLIIEIANKELKLITLLGFLLGGIIGILQGIIAIFV